MTKPPPHPVTPDGRYFVVRGRLWRTTKPGLSEAERAKQVRALMQARRDMKTARDTGDRELSADAKRRVQAAKVALGERGPVWWTDGDPDYNRHLAKNTPYRDWWAAVESGGTDKS